MKQKWIAILLSIVFCYGGTVLLAQSEHAKTVAKQLAITHPEYAGDILVTKPDFVVFAPEKELDKVGDTYNDHFQVFDKPDGTLFAVWTQGTTEGFHDMHIAFSRSFDKGLTWSKPVILGGSANNVNPQLTARWQQPLVSKSGRIYVLWNQQISNTGNQHCGEMFGVFSDNNGDTWSPPEKVTFGRDTIENGPDDPIPVWCNWQRPLRLAENDKYITPSSRHRVSYKDYRVVTEYIRFENIDANPAVRDIQLSWFMEGDNALTWNKGYSDTCEESSIVKLPDGRLFTVMRTAAGYPVWSVSSDRGETWTEPKPLRDRDGGEVYKQPRSPCPIYDRKGPEAGSGDYFMFVHNTFDPNAENEWQKRGPLYLLAGKFMPDAEQPVWFAPPQLFNERPEGNSFYTSCTLVDGKTVLWYGDKKFYLLGRYIGDEWFKYWDGQK